MDEERHAVGAALAALVTHEGVVVAMETHVDRVHGQVSECNVAVLTRIRIIGWRRGCLLL